MRKEIVWAIVAGILFGLVITFGVVRVNSTLKPKGESTTPSSTPESAIPEFKIALNKPENEDVIIQDSVAVSGITKPNALIAISGEEGDYILKSDEKGLFEEEVDLISGVNQIKITAFDPTGAQSIEKVLVVYSSAFEEKEGDRLEKAANKPKAYLGTVTDITDSTIQIRTTSSEIRQISVGNDTSVVKTDPTSKVVKLTDIAIGDFIVAMGYKNGNQVLSAQRILITPAVTEPKISVTMGKGADITPTKNTSVFLFKDGKVTKAKATSIEDESQVIYVTTEEAEKSSIRTIFLI